MEYKSPMDIEINDEKRQSSVVVAQCFANQWAVVRIASATFSTTPQ